MNLMRWFLLLGGLVWLTGCQQTVPSSGPEFDEDYLPYVSAAELESALSEQTGPVLVEFCVPVGCSRCDEMRPQVNRLAQENGDSLKVLRVNLNQERALTARMGITMCPTYIAFDRGQEVYRAAYPTSADLILSELSRVQPN